MDHKTRVDQASKTIHDNAYLTDPSFLQKLSHDGVFDLQSHHTLMSALDDIQSTINSIALKNNETKKTLLKDLFLINRISLLLAASHFNEDDRYKIKSENTEMDYWTYLREIDDSIFFVYDKILASISS